MIMALREINMNKMDSENAVARGPAKARLEPSERGPLGEIGNRAPVRCTAAPGKAAPGKAALGKAAPGKTAPLDLKNVKAKVVTHHLQQSVTSTTITVAKNSLPVAAQPRPPLRKPSATSIKVPVVQSSALSTALKTLPRTTTTCNTNGQKLKQALGDTKEAAFSTGQLPLNVEEIDKDDDPVVLSEYAADIYKYLRELEVKYFVRRGYLSGQSVTKRMRSVLIDWIIDVQQQFNLLQETLYLTVANIDRFLQSYRSIDRSHLQLAGMACMWVACKYEEMYCPDIGDFIYIADNTYTKEQIQAMECKVLKMLKFNLGRPLPLHFLRRFSKVAHSDPITHTLAKYFLELTLVEYDMCHMAPSLVAAASIFLALWLVGGETRTVWTPTLEYYSEYTLRDIWPAVNQIAVCVVNAPTCKYQATRNKFASSKLLKISTNALLQSPGLANLANTNSS